MSNNIAQRITAATIKFAETSEVLPLEMAEFLGELSAAIVDLDVQTAHVQRAAGMAGYPVEHPLTKEEVAEDEAREAELDLPIGGASG